MKRHDTSDEYAYVTFDIDTQSKNTLPVEESWCSNRHWINVLCGALLAGWSAWFAINKSTSSR